MQQTFSDMEYGKRYRKTRKDIFLAQMEEIIPWEEWISLIVLFSRSHPRTKAFRY